MEEEIWKDIPGYEGRYQASNLGRIRSLLDYHGRAQFLVLSQQLNTNGYYFVLLYKNNSRRFVAVHRLVCAAFHKNPNNYPCVNHRDENRYNNRADNLEWCTQKYNSNYGTRNKRISEKANKKPVIQISYNGTIISYYQTISNAAKASGSTKGTIWGCCNGRYKESAGYLWFYADDPDIGSKIEDFKRYYEQNSIIQESVDSEFIAQYLNAADASRHTGVDASCILKCAKNKRKSAGGYIWKYANKNGYVHLESSGRGQTL